MLIWYFSNNLDIHDYVGKLPEQHFSVWLFSNPRDKILFLLKFNEAMISEWNIDNKIWRKRMNQSVTHKDLCRTAPATAGLLNILDQKGKTVSSEKHH